MSAVKSAFLALRVGADVASRVRGAWLATRGARVGSGVVLRSGARLLSDDVNIASGCFLGEDVLIRARRIRIGEGAHIGAGTSIVADDVAIGDHAVLFDGVNVISLGRFSVGAYSKISRLARLYACSIDIGMEFWMNAGAEIGGGGWRAGRGRFRAGDRCHVGRGTHINVAEPVELGADTAIGMDCTLTTHAHWQPLTEGYYSRRGPIFLGSDVAIYTRAVIAPGVSIGDGATVAAGSVVLLDVAPRQFAAGVPAKAIRSATSGRADASLVTEILLAFAAARSLSPEVREDGGLVASTTSTGEIVAYPGFSRSPDPVACAGAVVVTFGLPAAPKAFAYRCLVDLDRRELSGEACDLSEALREFLFSYGIRFRYRDGYTRRPLTHRRLVELGLD